MNQSALSVTLDQLVRPLIKRGNNPVMVAECCGAVFVGNQIPDCGRCKGKPFSVIVSSEADIPKIAGQLAAQRTQG